MRFAAAALGVSLASAVAMPASSDPGNWKRAATAAQLVDLAPFEAGKFKLLSPEEVAAQASAASKDSSSSASPSSSKVSSVSSSDSKAATSSSPSTVNAVAACANPRTRVEWRNMSDGDRRAFVAATRCLMDRPPAAGFSGSQNRYEDLVWVHQQMADVLHNVAQFLPWHRYFLFIYEGLLRDECGYGGPMPWWDETRDAGAFSAAPLFTDDYFGPAPPKTDGGAGTCVDSGAFAGVTLHIGPGGGFSDHCLSRAVDESLTSQCNRGFVDMCNSYGDFASMAGCSEGGPHAYGHNGVGAVMLDVGPSPGDPVFFMHHCFIDRNWWAWQSADAANRLYQVGGYTNKQDPKQPLTLDFVLTSRGLKPDLTVNAVMDTQGETLCYKYDY